MDGSHSGGLWFDERQSMASHANLTSPVRRSGGVVTFFGSSSATAEDEINIPATIGNILPTFFIVTPLLGFLIFFVKK